MKTENSTISVAGERWIAGQVDSSRTRWSLIGLLFISVSANILLAGELIRNYHKDLAREPYIVRLDGSGKASAMTAEDLVYTPREAEIRHHLRRWTRLYYSRIHDQIAKSQAEAFHFFHHGLSRKQAQDTRAEIAEFIKQTESNQTEVTVKNIVPHLDERPYRADIYFTKTIQSPHQVVKTENWTVEVRFEFAKRIPEELVPYNPMGLLITYVHGEQDF